ncbi:chromosomal replication initiator protein DnaA [Longibacter salinarum]|uniref:Chromosomal replication initiator protein DnaA n=1 Tax=Longibacter salinarum TaxID=1850348 RepID=A0A2A8D1B9_9BACT|nr:chromosomal replication initiator protein DnaA [Longibacter salinarum]PEN14759.1 chromosomal replication initiator protein DnaA [Longibacter salinarum]
MVPSATDAWTATLKHLREEIPSQTVENWLVPIDPVSLKDEDDGVYLILEVPTAFNAQYLQSRFNNNLQQAVSKAVGQKTAIEFRVAEPSSQKTKNGRASSDGAQQRSSRRDRSGTSPRSETSGAGTGMPTRTSASESPSSSGRVSESPGDSRDLARAAAHPGALAGDGSPTGDPRTRPSRTQRGSGSRGRSAENRRPPAHKKVNRPDRQRSSRSGSSSSSRTVSTPPSHLKASYTFDEFIEGDGNRLARSAAVAVAESPGETNYNPLLIYGGVGLGKTHLAQAIANHALKKQTTESVLYVSSDRFTSQFVRAVKNNSIADFSAYYRQAELLIVDDVQFFGGKEKTQEEFFHIFNDLHQHGRQIVLCADRPPSEIDGIEERLLSRFQWGLSADIQRPDLETRIAILQRKASRRNIDVDPQVVELLAHRIDSNIRKLEGALNRLAAIAQLDNETLSMQTARQLLHDQIDDTSSSRVECGSIIETVADYYRLSVDDLLSRSRKREIAAARQTAMYLCRELTSESYASIGSRFGGRDHSTVIHANKKVSDRLDVESNFRQEIDELKRSIGGPGM